VCFWNTKVVVGVEWCCSIIEKECNSIGKQGLWDDPAYLLIQLVQLIPLNMRPGNTKGASITVPLTSCLTGLESAIWLLTIFVFICKTEKSRPVKQEVNGTVILLPLVFPDVTNIFSKLSCFRNTKIFQQVAPFGELTTPGPRYLIPSHRTSLTTSSWTAGTATRQTWPGWRCKTLGDSLIKLFTVVFDAPGLHSQHFIQIVTYELAQ
jgi:hypothetical protein